LVRQIGAEKFETMISLAVPLEDFLFDAVAEGLNIRTMEGRATFSKRAAPLLDRLPKGVFRELMFESLATRTGLSRNVLQELINEHLASAQEATASNTLPAAPNTHADEQVPQDIPFPRKQDLPKDLAPAMAVTFDYDDAYIEQEIPPADYDQYYHEEKPRQHRHPLQPELQPSATSKYLMPPARKALALLLTHPSLANDEPDHDFWLAIEDDTDLLMLGRLLKVLHERPHYNLSHLIGYWRGTYGAENTERLALVAGHDLLQATQALTQTRNDKPAKADYDTQAAFRDAIEKLRLQQNHKKSAVSLATLKNSDFTQLSKEERERLVRAALANKLQH